MATKVCVNGHTFEKTSDCPVCPTCSREEMEVRKGDIPFIGGPAMRALEGIGVTTLDALTQHTEQELLALHGLGPKALRILSETLREKGMAFRKP